MSYCNIAHATGSSPAKMMYGLEIQCKLDLLKPTEKSSVRNCKANEKFVQFSSGERVSARNYSCKVKWSFGEVRKRTGKLHYQVELDDG